MIKHYLNNIHMTGNLPCTVLKTKRRNQNALFSTQISNCECKRRDGCLIDTTVNVSFTLHYNNLVFSVYASFAVQFPYCTAIAKNVLLTLKSTYTKMFRDSIQKINRYIFISYPTLLRHITFFQKSEPRVYEAFLTLQKPNPSFLQG